MSTPINPIGLLEIREHYVCPNEACEQRIPDTHAAPSLNRQTGVRTVRIVCPSCGGIFEAEFVQAGGQWVRSSEIRPVIDARTAAGLRKRIGKTLGQMEALSA